MHKINVQSLAEQYKTSANLDARIALHARFSVNPYPWFQWMFDHYAALPSTARIISLGCGTALLWAENRARLPAGWRVTLTDLSPGMLAQARENLRDAPPVFTWAVADAQTIPCADGVCDAVFANHMLYHVPDRPRALAEIRRVLKPGGALYATTVGDRHMRELWGLAEPLSPGIWERVTRIARGFTLENGVAQLTPFFARVTRDDYADNLAVTEVEPLIAYLASSASLAAQWSPAQREAGFAALRERVAARLAAEGAIHITKASGMFVAYKSP